MLAALQHECVHATFFMLGRNAAAHPGLAKRVLADGHTVAHHSYRHPLLNRMSLERAEAEIDLGIAAVEAAIYGEPGGPPRTPFFRFPVLPAARRCWSGSRRAASSCSAADLWPGDWNPMTPKREHAPLKRLTAAGAGIVLLHDTQAKTAAMLPELLRELRRGGYRIVHVVPGAVKDAR